MTKVSENISGMIEALVNEGWNRERAEEYIAFHAARHAISDEVTALKREYYRLKRLFKKVQIAPLFVCLADAKLYVPKWYLQQPSDALQPLQTVADEEILSLF